ncbi:MAG: TrkA family potassium uptake protein [Coriobacteriales bacterium]|nr:TrkA family potassium uptake protein [Coriobacteriales bacterium]
MNVVIVGCGRVGASLGRLLSGMGESVAVIDCDAKAFSRLGSEYQGRVVVGQGFDEETLIQAGIRDCDAFAAVTGSDNVNLMASEVAKRLYKVPRVIARLIDPERMNVYQQLGLDYICDTELVAESIAAMIHSTRSHHLDTFGAYEVLTFTLETRGGALMVRDLEDLGDIKIALCSREEEALRATANTFIHDGDTILATVHIDSLDALIPYMRK